ncbi:hypothetical protein CRENBAI_003806 [Crenichthys baileyi]|uniref:Uncharacterized protein n=1 Tax=Crenichthys baileyi TaxID=28760 RepID=A0AAV9SG00_9TELE
MLPLTPVSRQAHYGSFLSRGLLSIRRLSVNLCGAFLDPPGVLVEPTLARLLKFPSGILDYLLRVPTLSCLCLSALQRTTYLRKHGLSTQKSTPPPGLHS